LVGSREFCSFKKRTEQKSLEAGKQLFYLRKGNKKDSSTGAAKLESKRDFLPVKDKRKVWI